MRRKITGALYGAFASACYGTNPLFALPLYSQGLSVNTVLLYRYLLAVVIFYIWLKFFKKISLKITKQEIFPLFVMGIMFSLSSLTLFESFKYIDAGIACTMLFIYPILVALIMRIFFGEKLSPKAVFAIILTFFGILLLYKGKSNESLNLTGIIFVMGSALSYALYIVGVKNIKIIKHINPSKMCFYVMLFGLFVYLFNIIFNNEPPKSINGLFQWIMLLGIAIFPTILSIETINISIKLVGSTTAAVLGALEPLTAIFFGVLLFHEQLTIRICTGIILILCGVIIMVLSKNKKACIQN